MCLRAGISALCHCRPHQGRLKLHGIAPHERAVLKAKAQPLAHRNKARADSFHVPGERDWGCSWHIPPVKKKVDFKESWRFLERLEKGEGQLLALQEVRTPLSLLKPLQFKSFLYPKPQSMLCTYLG